MNITNEVLAAKLDAVGERVEKFELKLDNLGKSYVQHDIFELRMKEMDLRITEIQSNLRRISSSRWLQNTLSAILGAIMSILVAYFFTHISGGQ